MTPVTGMVVGCLGSWLLVVAVSGGAAGREVPLGMIGPLLAVVATWIVVVRAHRADPAGVTAVMMKAFAAKMVFFAVYVVAMMAFVRVDPMRFVISFACYFLVLYLAEAVLLQRLFTRGLQESR
jgi:hypothetical protein